MIKDCEGNWSVVVLDVSILVVGAVEDEVVNDDKVIKVDWNAVEISTDCISVVALDKIKFEGFSVDTLLVSTELIVDICWLVSVV